MALFQGLVCLPRRGQASAVQIEEEEGPADPAAVCSAPWPTVGALRCGGPQVQSRGRCSALRGPAALDWACRSRQGAALVRSTSWVCTSP